MIDIIHIQLDRAAVTARDPGWDATPEQPGEHCRVTLGEAYQILLTAHFHERILDRYLDLARDLVGHTLLAALAGIGEVSS